MTNEFFTRYAEAMRAADVSTIASMYAKSFLVAGPKGSATFENDEKFIEWLKSVDNFNKKTGMKNHRVVGVEKETRLSAAHTQATVEWGTTFEKTGNREIRFKITYLLEDLGEGPKILAYVSEEDQEEAMAKEGLLPPA